MPDRPERLAAALSDRYRIERELGQGGMATVYLAEDLKHERKVALKVLKPELAAVLGADRFVQEIKTTASLQHPHILPLFDSGSADGFLYYVMPYIEGETLRDKLNRETQLGIDEAVKITTEIADALDYAHRQNVIHRDIKPENILLHDGRPMVADFGIALAVSAAAGGRMTETGLSLGTPHYMSPEQATADKDISAKSDIYSLASVLYEMLAGQPPHLGGSAQQIIMKIIAEPVAAVTSLRKNVSPNVAAALAQALEKLPADRFETAKAFAEALTNPAFAMGGTSAQRLAARGPTRSRSTLTLVVALAFALVAAAWGWLRPTASDDSPMAFSVHLTPSESDPAFVASDVAMTPDGSAIIFSDSVAGVRQLWIKRREDPDPVPIPGTRGGRAPFVSPDGSSIAYTEGQRLMRVPLAGGSAVMLSDSASTDVNRSGVWLADGTLVILAGGGDFLLAVGEDGTRPRRVITSDALGGYPVHLSAGPRAGSVLATICPYSHTCLGGHVELVDLGAGGHRTLLPQATGAWLLPGRRLLYVLPDGSAFVASFRDDTTVTAGVPVFTGVLTGYGGAELHVNVVGTVLYATGAAGDAGGLADLVAASAAGIGRVDSSFSAPIAPNSGLDLSPDGRRALFSVSDPTDNRSYLAIKDLASGPAVRLTTDGTTNIRGVWHPDGRHVAWISDRGGRFEAWLTSADGSAAPTLLASEDRNVYGINFSPDGQWVLYRTDDVAPGKGDIYARRTSGDTGTIVTIAASDAEETSPAVSPDGRWVAYSEGLSGTKEVVVRPFPDAGGGRVQVSVGGGTEPAWSRDGRTLYYRNYSGEFIAAQVTRDPVFRVEHRSVVTRQSRVAFEANDDGHTWALMPDGAFLLVHRPGLEASASNRRLVLREGALSGSQGQP